MSENSDLVQEFEKLYKELYPGLVLFSYKFVKDKEVAKDIVQQVFIHYYEKKNSNEIKAIKSYLFSAVRNSSLNHIRNQQTRERHHGLIKGSKDHIQRAYSMEATELEQAIHKIIGELPERCQLIFRMNRLKGFRNKEIAEQLGLSIRTVETQISKALKILRKRIPPDLLNVIKFLIPLFFIP